MKKTLVAALALALAAGLSGCSNSDKVTGAGGAATCQDYLTQSKEKRQETLMTWAETGNVKSEFKDAMAIAKEKKDDAFLTRMSNGAATACRGNEDKRLDQLGLYNK